MLKNKVVLVIGGNGLLGRSVAEAVSLNGARVIISDILSAQAPSSTIPVSQILPGAEDFIASDITSEQSIDNLISSTVEKYGKIDGVVNTAYPRNRNYGSDLESVTYPDFCENLDLHLGGYFLVLKKFTAYMKTRGKGSIISFSSIYGSLAPRFEIYSGTPMTMPVEYAAIKAGIIQLTRYFAKYYKGSGFRVNTISPGGILNGQPEAFVAKYRQYSLNKGMLDPSDISGSVIFLLSDQSEFINGQEIIVDDGFTL